MDIIDKIKFARMGQDIKSEIFVIYFIIWKLKK